MTVGSRAGRRGWLAARRSSGEQARGAGRREGGGVLVFLVVVFSPLGSLLPSRFGPVVGVQRGKSAVS